MRNTLGTTGSGKNTPRTSVLSKFMLGTTVAATMAIAPVQNTIAADVATPKAGSAPQKQHIINGWYFMQNNGKFVPFDSTNPEHKKAIKLYALGLDPKTNTYKPVKEVSRQGGTTSGVFTTIENIGTKVTNAASNFMGNTMSGVGDALGYIGKPTPQPFHIERNNQIPPAPKAQPETYSNPKAMLKLLVKDARSAKQLPPSQLRTAREAFKWVQESNVSIKEPDLKVLKQWLGV